MTQAPLQMHQQSCSCCRLHMHHPDVAKQVMTLASQKQPEVAPNRQGESSTATLTGKERLQAAFHHARLQDQPTKKQKNKQKKHNINPRIVHYSYNFFPPFHLFM